jgi:nitroreductase
MNKVYLISIIFVVYIIFENYTYVANVGQTPIPNSFIKNLYWRRAEKHFLSGPVNIKSIKSAILNAPSSYGIQPFHVLVIKNPNVKKSLLSACYGQKQVKECYCLFIFCALNNLEDRINQYVKETGFNHKKKYMIKYINDLPSKLEWSKRQAYIALGFGIAAAMELNIASCPMEGFQAEKISKILNLKDNLVPCVLLAVGRKNNNYKLEKRFRFDKKDLFSHLNNFNLIKK